MHAGQAALVIHKHESQSMTDFKKTTAASEPVPRATLREHTVMIVSNIIILFTSTNTVTAHYKIISVWV